MKPGDLILTDHQGIDLYCFEPIGRSGDAMLVMTNSFGLVLDTIKGDPFFPWCKIFIDNKVGWVNTKNITLVSE